MKRLIPLALIAAVAAPVAADAQPVTSMALNCGGGAATRAGESPSLHGNWDILFDAGGTPNFGLLAVGLIDTAYGGSLSLWGTAPVVVRNINLTGNSIQMTVASPGGDVLFDGTLSAKGDRMCGTVTYHDGRKFPMVAQKRSSAYQPRPPARPGG